jgi:DNA polymerase elongation subunit (family B)
VYGKYILYRGIEGGKHVSRRVAYRPTFFVPSKNKSKYKTLAGDYVEPVEPGDINDAREFLERYKDVETFPIYGNNRYDYTYISDQFPEDVIWDRKYIAVAYLDIEVGSENGFPEPELAAEEVLAITLKMGDTFYTFATGDYTPHRPDVNYTRCKDEVELLKSFLAFWSVRYPDIITGWNVKFFDIPYLINRMIRVLGEKEANQISPWKKVKSRETYIMNRKQQSYEIFGIATLDYSDLYRKYSPKSSQESYRLDHIAFVELGEKKMDYSEYETLHQLYKKDFQKYIEYNIHDVYLVEQIEERGLYSSKLIELALTLAYDNKCNYEDVFTQVRMWDAIIFNHLKAKGIVIPQQRIGDKESAYSGAYVKEPRPGMYKWVVSFDLNSLYPHLIMQYNISPETLIQPEQYSPEMREIYPAVSVDAILHGELDLTCLKDLNVTLTPNKQFFTTAKRGFLGEIMDTMYKDRSRYKKMAIEAKKKLQEVKDDPNQYAYVQREIARYNNLQMAKKVSLNSAYGAIGNQYFRFFDIRNAEAITLGGQLSARWIETHMNEYLNKLLGTEKVDYVIACDTDSMYLNLEPLVKKIYDAGAPTKKIIDFLDKACDQKLQPFIDRSFQELAEYVNAYEQKMFMKRESLCDRAIWTAKKRYILNVWNEEGVEYKDPKIKITGLEAIKSSTPQACRDKIREGIKMILDKDEESVIKFIADFREEFKKLPVEAISFPRSVNSLNDYVENDSYKKGTPIHVKGALLYNRLLREKHLDNKFEKIKGGEKIKFCYLKQHNPLYNNTIAFINTLPKELGVHSHIDYDTQFDKAFVEPMRTILNCIGWQATKVYTLDDFFS